MPGVTRRQIERAKQVGILGYILSHEPGNVKQVGNAYRLKDHDSLEISNGLWHWHSQGVGGKNVVDYLIKVRGYSFVDAVLHLAGSDARQTHTTPEPRPPTKPKTMFSLPRRNGDNERVIAYLQGRGIAKALILGCIERGSTYQTARWGNCVFVGRDDSGKARYATMRGTAGDFKRDADGSDKRFGFILPPNDKHSDAVAVFESPVDVLSHQVLCPEFNGWRLSLGCTSPIALTSFLGRRKDVKSVLVGTDNDRAGNAAAAKIALLPDAAIARILPPAGNNDWNEALIAAKSENKPSLIGWLESAKLTAADMNSHAGRGRAGQSPCH
jgi:hypothetical protein